MALEVGEGVAGGPSVQVPWNQNLLMAKVHCGTGAHPFADEAREQEGIVHGLAGKQMDLPLLFLSETW